MGDIGESNADRIPAFVVLMNRFVESVRSRKDSFERLNLETNQILPVVNREPDDSLNVEGGDIAGGVIRAPGEPGFVAITRGGAPLLDAAAHFADVREADFRTAASMDTIGTAAREILERNSREDVLTPVSALLLGLLCLGNWALSKRG